jgi:hypothetical protein
VTPSTKRSPSAACTYRSTPRRLAPPSRPIATTTRWRSSPVRPKRSSQATRVCTTSTALCSGRSGRRALSRSSSPTCATTSPTTAHCGRNLGFRKIKRPDRQGRGRKRFMGGHLDTPLTRQPRSSRFLCRSQATCSRVLQSPLEGRCSRRTALEGQRGLTGWERSTNGFYTHRAQADRALLTDRGP